MHNHLEVSCPEDVAKMEEEFAEVIRKRGPDFKYFQVSKTKLLLKNTGPGGPHGDTTGIPSKPSYILPET